MTSTGEQQENEQKGGEGLFKRSNSLSNLLSLWAPIEKVQQEEDLENNHGNSNSLTNYFQVVWNHPDYRAFVVSHICMHMGGWLVKISSLVAIERLINNNNTNSSMSAGKAISYYAVIRLLPHALFAPLGGILADRFDRRKLMIVIDLLSAIVVLLFPLVALRNESLTAFYAVTFVQSTLGALYYPTAHAIVPLLVKGNPSDLKYAITINSSIWGICAILGGFLVGVTTESIGLEGCYYVHCATYMISAFVLTMCMTSESSYSVFNNSDIPPSLLSSTTSSTATTTATSSATPSKWRHVIRDLFKYLVVCGFGVMVFQRASASSVWGMEDIINAEFSTLDNEDDGSENNEVVFANKIGMIYSVSGAGCFVGPSLLNLFTNSHYPYTYQRACLVGLVLLSIGWLIIGLSSSSSSAANNTFALILVGTFIRTMGSGSIWMNSNLALQTLTDPRFLGRVLAVDYTLTILMEAISVAIAGIFSERGYNATQLSWWGMVTGLGMVVVWSILYYFNIGAANPRFNNGHGIVIRKSSKGSASPKSENSAPIDDSIEDTTLLSQEL